MKKSTVVPFASSAEALGYQMMLRQRNETAQALAAAAGEIAKRGGVSAEGATTSLVEGGLSVEWDEPEPAEAAPS